MKLDVWNHICNNLLTGYIERDGSKVQKQIYKINYILWIDIQRITLCQVFYLSDFHMSYVLA